MNNYTSYSDKLKSPLWQKKRLKIMERDNFSCVDCGSKLDTLNVHHETYIKGRMPWEYEDDLLCTLCENCHSKRHKKVSADENLKSISELLSELAPGSLLEKLRNDRLVNKGSTDFNQDNLKMSWLNFISTISVEKKINLVNACCLSSIIATGENLFLITACTIADKNIIEENSKLLSDHLHKYFKSIITFKIVANENLKNTA